MTQQIWAITGTRARIAGVGETEYVRGTEKSTVALRLEASLAACRDAGIPPAEIDGVVIPGSHLEAEQFVAGLGITDLRFSAHNSMGGAGTVAAVAVAAGAVRAGLARRVLVAAGSAQFSGGRRLSSAEGGAMSFRWPGQAIRDHLEYPYGVSVPMQWYSLHANRWLAETGADRTGMRDVALSTRQHAHRNAKAYFRGRPLSAQQYDESPLVVEPFRLFDIVSETDGAAAVVVDRADADLLSDHRPVLIAGGGEGHADVPDDLVTRPDMLQMGLTKLAPRLFAEVGISCEDLDFAQIYDCFTFVVLRQLEELGFCERGEAPSFVRERGIGPGGGLPVNTHGGLLSQGHIAGMNHVVEAVLQLRGAAGEAQVPNAGLGVVTGYGDMSDGSMLVLTR